MDESRFTHITSKGMSIPNSPDYKNTNKDNKLPRTNNLAVGEMSNGNYQEGSLHPEQKRQNAVKVIPISKPKA